MELWCLHTTFVLLSWYLCIFAVCMVPVYCFYVHPLHSLFVYKMSRWERGLMRIIDAWHWNMTWLMRTTLNCIFLTLDSWEFSVSSRIIIFVHEHYRWKALGCMQSILLLRTSWMYNRNRMLILPILDCLKSFCIIAMDLTWSFGSLGVYLQLSCTYSFILMSRTNTHVYLLFVVVKRC